LLTVPSVPSVLPSVSSGSGLVFAVAATLLRHRGHGPEHWDLVFAAGARCPTLSLRRERGRWRASWLPAHRRRYLAFAGALGGGRGSLTRAWRGRARCIRAAAGWRIACQGGTTLTLRTSRLGMLGPWPPRMPSG